jgi:surface polysaccharide O-acyltransferase-like enzyme
MKSDRIQSLDLLRGLAVMLIILFHSSIYNFANIHLLDFSNPPIIVVLISFMGLWGGMFIIYSMALNTLMLGSATRSDRSFRPFLFLIVAGLIYLAVHFLLNLFLGRWNVDFVNNQPLLTGTAYLLRNGSFQTPETMKLYDGSSVGTIGMNLILLSLILSIIFRKRGMDSNGYFYWVAGLTGTAIMLLSFVRVWIYPFFAAQTESGNYLAGILLSFLIANPYPLLPYLAYGIFGVMIGLMIHQRRDLLLKRLMVPLGLFFLVYGIAGMMNFDKTISKPDFFWYFKTNFELGLFILMVVLCRFIPAPGSRLLSGLTLIQWFSRVSLTIYLLETTVSESLRIAGLRLIPGWNETINGCLLFGALNIVIWAIILFFWQKVGFRYSLEYFWVILFDRLGKKSTKLISIH